MTWGDLSGWDQAIVIVVGGLLAGAVWALADRYF